MKKSLSCLSNPTLSLGTQRFYPFRVFSRRTQDAKGVFLLWRGGILVCDGKKKKNSHSFFQSGLRDCASRHNDGMSFVREMFTVIDPVSSVSPACVIVSQTTRDPMNHPICRSMRKKIETKVLYEVPCANCLHQIDVMIFHRYSMAYEGRCSPALDISSEGMTKIIGFVLTLSFWLYH